MSIIEFKNVSKNIGKRKILEDISFKIEKGQVYGLLGPNGAGKTTIIKLMTELLNVTSGEILWFGENNSIRFKKKLGLILHDDGLYLSFSGYKNLKFFSSLQGQYSEKDLIKVLDEVGLLSAKDELVSTYSQGMKKRLCLARCILRNPDVIVLDEPTTGLDIDGKHWFTDKIKGLQKNGATVIISSHNLNEVETICSHIAIIRDGKLKFEDSIDNILKSSDNSIEKTYLRTGER